jgi:hypothetical protein
MGDWSTRHMRRCNSFSRTVRAATEVSCETMLGRLRSLTRRIRSFTIPRSMLAHKVDPFNSVIVDRSSLPEDELAFGKSLESSLFMPLSPHFAQ